MAHRVRVLDSLLPGLARHPRRSDFWALHQLLEEAADPFDYDEVGCIPVRAGLRREVFISRGGMIVVYWEHPDGDVEIVQVNFLA